MLWTHPVLVRSAFAVKLKYTFVPVYIYLDAYARRNLATRKVMIDSILNLWYKQN